MTDVSLPRKLTTIVALDVAGYSARAEADEARATAEVAAMRAVIEAIAAEHGGAIFNTAGDGFMLEFGSSLAAVIAAETLARRCEPAVRVGVHLGDVVIQPDGDLLGHGVNVAARLMARSAPGAVLVSAAVRQTIRGSLSERMIPCGPLTLDKMAEVIEAFSLGASMAGHTLTTSAAAPPTATAPVLGVLPFDNLSSDPELQFFSDGISEDIIQRLSRGAGLKVIGRTSSFRFRGQNKSEAARALRCSHVLDGSVRRSGTRVRIAAHLVDANAQTTLWSDRYDRALDDTFAVQDEIAEAISTSMNQRFTRSSSRSVDGEAYDLFLRASPRAFSPAELHSLVPILEKVVERAPEFAEAWGRLAFLRAFLSSFQPFRGRPSATRRVAHERERALALDPANAEAIVAGIWVLPPYGAFREMSPMLERLRALPEGVSAKIWTGFYSRLFGFMREAEGDTERAYALDPLSPMAANAVALARMARGNYTGVVSLLEDLMARVPDMHFAVANLMRAHAFLGNWDAVDSLLDPAAARPLRELEDGVLFIRTKRDPTAAHLEAMRERLALRFRQTGAVEVSSLVYAAHVGLGEEAYGYAATARLGPTGTGMDVIGPDAYRTGLLFWEGMPEIRQDPRFAALCARLGLVDYWISSGRWPDCVDSVPYDFRMECERALCVAREPFDF